MATLTEIANADRYAGNPISGGGFYQGVTIDTSPLQRLATFTYYRDRDLWQKKQVDDKDAAQKIADLTAYDIHSPLKGYTDYLTTQLKKINEFVTQNPNSLNYGKDRDGYIKREAMQRDFLNARKAANTSEVIYSSNQAAIDKLPEGPEKEAAKISLRNRVNKLFSNGIEGALNNTLSSAEELKPNSYTLPKLVLTKRVETFTDANTNRINKYEIGDIPNLRNQAFAVWAGMKPSTYKESAEFEKLNDDEKELAIAQDKVINKDRLAIQRTVDTFNGMLEQLKISNIDPLTGKPIPVKIDSIDINSLPNGTLKENIISAKALNEQIDKINTLKGEKNEKINLNDGLSGDEVLILNSFQQSGNTFYSEIDKDIQYTGAADRLKLERIQQSGANYRAALSSGTGTTTGEARNFMDLTGYTGQLTIADIAAIDPNSVTNENGVLKLNYKEDQKTFDILPNGDVQIFSYTTTTNNGKKSVEKKLIKTVPKSTYQRNAVTVTQTILKDRKGEDGNPFTFTGLSETKKPTTETDAQYYQRTGKFRQK